jgi:hypothetical protein
MPTLTQTAPPAVSSHRALEIAEADAVTVYKDLSIYRIELWLDEAGWHVEYHIRQTSRFLTGGGPHYVIHPETGEIVSKKYYQ